MEYPYYGLLYRGSLHFLWVSLSFIYSLSYLPFGYSIAYPILWIIEPIKSSNVFRTTSDMVMVTIQTHQCTTIEFLFKRVIDYGQDVLPYTYHILCEYLNLKWGLLAMFLIHSLDYHIMWVMVFPLLTIS